MFSGASPSEDDFIGYIDDTTGVFNFDGDLGKFGGRITEASEELLESGLYLLQEHIPTLQWVTFNNGDTIPSDLDIYGFSGAAYVLGNSLTYDVNDKIRITPDKNRVYIEINCNNANCYNNEVTSNTNVQLIFSNIGCCDYYNFNSAVRGGTLQLYIYA